MNVEKNIFTMQDRLDQGLDFVSLKLFCIEKNSFKKLMAEKNVR